MRPSWGSRFSAMSSFAMIFRRDVIASRNFIGGAITSYSMPSMRNRTRNSFSYGSMWMSLAPFWMADISIRFTSRMIGASPPWRSSEATSIWSSSSRTSTSSSTAVSSGPS